MVLLCLAVLTVHPGMDIQSDVLSKSGPGILFTILLGSEKNAQLLQVFCTH